MRDLPAPAGSGVAEPAPLGQPRRVLVTGASRGIGRATASAFLDEGWSVVATARRAESVADLAAAGMTAVALDVTDEASMRAAVDEVARTGPVDVLVNNAGYGLYGPVEHLQMADIVDEFATNVFGAVRLCQLFLPQLRERRGRIVNVSSVAGRLGAPLGGAYHASKHALEAFSDALRVEVGAFGVHVALIEPGPVVTEWAARAVATYDGSASAHYGAFVEKALASTRHLASNPFASTPASVARTILAAATSPRPRARYRVGIFANAALGVHWLLPDAAFDRLLAWWYRR